MILNIVVLFLLAGITFMHSIFGLFSGMINTFCCILAAVVALGSFEAVDRLLTGQFGMPPSYTTACSLIVLFVGTLLILRALADNLIRGNVRLPQAVDWGGAAACGFLNAMICMGIMVIGIQLLPFGGRVMMFQRIERTPDLDGEFVKFQRSGVWLNPDGFTVALVNMLSSGSLRGETTFASVYPDFTRWVYWTSNTVQPESLTAPIVEKGRRDGVKDGLSVKKWWTEAGPIDARYRKDLPSKNEPDPAFKRFEQYSPKPGMKIIGATVALSPLSADRDKHAPHHRFRPSMIRIVGQDGSGRPLDYPCRILRGTDDPNRKDFRLIVDIDQNFAIASNEDWLIDFYFEVDSDFEPRFIEYRRFARAPFVPDALVKVAPAKAPVNVAAAPADDGSGAPVQGTRSGQFGFVDVLAQGSGPNVDLPFQLSTERVRAIGDVEVTGEEIVKGRFSGPRQQLESEPLKPKLAKLRVPDGFRLCQIRFNPNRARTTIGQVFNFVARTVNQYHAVDNEGEKYPLVGYYAIVERDGAPYFEFFYNGPKDSPHEGDFNGMLNFKSIQGGELTRDSNDVEIGLLFFVPPGKTIRGVENQGGQGARDLLLPMGE